MRQKLAFILGLAAGLALVRLFRRRRAPPQGRAVDPRATGLRRKLAEQREVPAGEPPPAAEPAAAEEPPSAEQVGVEDARRRIYEEGRAAVEEMRRSSDSPARERGAGPG